MAINGPGKINTNQANLTSKNTKSLSSKIEDSHSRAFTQNRLNVEKNISNRELNMIQEEKDKLLTGVYVSKPQFIKPIHKANVLDCRIQKADQARQDFVEKIETISPIIKEQETTSPPNLDPDLIKIFNSLGEKLRSSTVIFPKERKT
jgi:hypothetical protein